MRTMFPSNKTCMRAWHCMCVCVFVNSMRWNSERLVKKNSKNSTIWIRRVKSNSGWLWYHSMKRHRISYTPCDSLLWFVIQLGWASVLKRNKYTRYVPYLNTLKEFVWIWNGIKTNWINRYLHHIQKRMNFYFFVSASHNRYIKCVL